MRIQSIIYVLLLLLCPHAKAQDVPVKLQLKWWHQFQFAGYYAAQIKGYYKAAGLNVEITPGKQHLSPVSEVLNGNADFGVTGADLLLNFTEGQPVKVLGAIFQHSPYVVISSAKKNIISPGDFKGKSIMCAQNQGIVELKALALRYGTPLDSLNLVEHTWKNDDIVNGKADAMTGYSSVEVFQLREKGHEVNMIRPSNYGIDFYGDVIFSSKKMVETKPDITDRFLKASFAGWEYAMKNPVEIVRYIMTLPGVKERGVTEKALLYEAGEMKSLLLPNVVQMGHMSETRWNDILDIYKRLNMVADNQGLDGFIYDRQKATEENLLRKALIVMGIIIIVLGLLFAYSISLKRAVRKRTAELEEEIVRRKKQEAGLEKMSHELQARNTELQQFAYLTSHNLRAPVTNLRSLLKLFDKTVMSERNRMLFDKIEISVANFNQMLSDLNEILSARKREVTPFKTLVIENELQFVLQSISETATEQNLNLSYDFSAAPIVECSQEVLHSVLLNLLTNAIKYKQPGSNPEVSIHTHLEANFVVLTVKDKGIGINLEKHASRLFTPYQRFHHGTDGKGLGLYLIKTQVEKVGGRITVESKENSGTKFCVFFKQNN
ncbi:MAG: hypothetical protein EOO03_00375 [Chitinophagaceae bacterium]|nr:MAG: hypothetical protein EOO03_00375 [Chitinophagaceae bacterium]